jgi:uncharacterized protein YndB with AHSA1/START domain
MSDPLVVEFPVRAGADHAFAMWTERTALWWPAAHTVSGGPEAVVFDPWPGGRVYERAPDGVEHRWGTVLEWEPPVRLRYLWHLFFDPAEATEVEITFRSEGDQTVVRLEHRGWELLGEAGAPRRTRTGDVWAELTAAYARAVMRWSDRTALPGAP